MGLKVTFKMDGKVLLDLPNTFFHKKKTKQTKTQYFLFIKKLKKIDP